jgi:hypothetical protein
MTPHQFRAALKALGLTYHTAAKAFSMGKWGYQSVGKWARGESAIPGGVAVAVQLMLEREGLNVE